MHDFADHWVDTIALDFSVVVLDNICAILLIINKECAAGCVKQRRLVIPCESEWMGSNDFDEPGTGLACLGWPWHELFLF